MDNEKIKSYRIGVNSGIIYACYIEKNWAGEHFIEDFGITYLLEGTYTVTDNNKTNVFRAGDMLFYRKNQLAKFVKQPAENGIFRGISIILDKDTLWNFSKQYHHDNLAAAMRINAVTRIEPNVLLKHYFDSLEPYFETQISDELIALKKQEAIILLLQSNPELKNILFDFSMPGKIDLEAFMNKNFKFNVEIKRLAYLTGRSLATFKRDFEKTFQTSPNRWLQQRRLQEAYYLIKEKKQKPSDVYLEVGFESLSHFSYSFKQHFGQNPSSIT
ncbi:AraC family transcriptional regulator [Arachidicoccus ginsenosidimutans]|nr:AraC family transcriptional regulator [Arachidicoccus sp. BS20]